VRIALTITELDPGGAEQCLVHLAKHLSAHNHQVSVFALGPTPFKSLGKSPNRDALTEQLDRANIPWKCGPARGVLSIFAVTRWLRAELDRFQPDIIQSMLFHGNLVTALANRGRETPLLGGARVSQTQRWRQIAQRWTASRMKKVVCVSQSVANSCEHVEGIPAQKLVVIPNGVIPSDEQVTTRPEALQGCLPSTDTPFLLFVGRLSDQKGIAPLIEQADSLLEKLPDHHLIALGDGPLKDSLQNQLQTTKHGSRVHLLGWQPAAHQWMKFAKLLLLPSKYEGMPNVILEAMQSGIPVVSFNVEGVEELLGKENIQIVSGSLSEFISRVHQLSIDSVLSSQLAADNRRRVAEDFRLDDQLAKYEELYLQLLDTSSESKAS
jgi:glycosyltransferase involved in cell wall biosynthesis